MTGSGPLGALLEGFLDSTSIVALSEIGGKARLLFSPPAYRKPLPIVARIMAATLLNHALAGRATLSERIAHRMPGRIVHEVATVVFVALGAVTLLP